MSEEETETLISELDPGQDNKIDFTEVRPCLNMLLSLNFSSHLKYYTSSHLHCKGHLVLHLCQSSNLPISTN